MNEKKEKTQANTASGFSVAMILLGIAVTPVLLASSGLGSSLPLQDAFYAILLGGIILTLISIITISIGARARMVTYDIIKYSFGTRGAQAINLLLAVSLFGWIIVVANSFGHSAQGLIAKAGLELPVPLLVAAGCVIFVASTAFGFSVLSKVAQIAVPVIALTLCYVTYTAMSNEAPALVATAGMEFGVAVSSIVGTIIVLVTLSPDFGSFVHNRKHAVIAALVTFAVAYPILFFVGAIPSTMTGQSSLPAAMAMFASTIPAALLILFATITANAGNMFQGTLVTSTLVPSIPKKQITIGLGILAAIVGSFDILGWFIPFLLFLGIATPPVAGIYIADYFLNRRAGYDVRALEKEAGVKPFTFFAWGIGALVGYLTANGYFTLTYIPSLDSMFVASACFAILALICARK